MRETITDLWALPGVRAAGIVLASIAAGYLVELIFSRVFLALTGKTKTEVDDQTVEALRRPVFLSVLLIGMSVASMQLTMPRQARFAVYGVLETIAVFTFAMAALRIGTLVLTAVSRRGKKSLIQPRTVPIFDMLIKMTVIGLAVYFCFLAWHVDVTAWLASAGIIGIAVGFAAKDTLANLFSGIFIVADAPYKIGDFIVLDGSLRGRVTKIGMRSTRILTLDDVEITVPNAVIGNSKIVNETGGPDPKQRLAVDVQAAYGSDVDKVTEVMLGCADGVSNLAETPKPQVLFCGFGASGLDFRLYVWVLDAARREHTLSELNYKIYKAFAVAGIEIPYSKHDVYIKEMAAPQPSE